METITCEVVKDLLPLYVDGVLSEASRALVEAHLAACPQCKAEYERMRDSAVPMTGKRAAHEKAAFQRIRKKINTKRVCAVCLTAVLVAAIAAGLFYGVVVRESYVPYQDAGLYTEGSTLHTNAPFYRYFGFGSPEEGTVFIYLTTTVYESHKSQKEDTLIDVFHEETPPPDEDGTVNEVTQPAVNRVYYIPQEYVKLLRQGYWIPAESEADYLAKNQERLEELKEKSVLVWEAE